MAFDLKGFYKDLGFTPEEEAAVSAALDKPERLKLLEGNQLRQSDYSREKDKLAKAQTELEAAKQRLDAEALEWAGLSAKDKTAATELRDSLEKAQAKVLTLTQRVERIATDAGLDPAKALEGIDQPPPKKEPETPAVDTSKFVGVDQFQSMSEYLFHLGLEIPAIAAEHQELSGERLDTRAFREEVQKRAKTKGANLDPRAIWEDMHQIQAKRDAKAKASREEEIKQAETRGFERAKSEAALPVPPSQGFHSPVLRTTDGAPRESILKRPAPESSVRAAAAALATGKYRQPTGAAK